MRTSRSIRRYTYVLVSLLATALLLVLAACGTASGSSGSSGSSGGSGSVTPGITPTSPGVAGAQTPTVTTTGGYGTSHGCPSDTVVNPPLPKANVTVQPDVKAAVTAHVGDIIEVHLPFGQKWGGPTSSQGGLELQKPAGYASLNGNVCVWRFVARSTGTAALNFNERALCKQGQMCPMYVRAVPVTINVTS